MHYSTASGRMPPPDSETVQLNSGAATSRHTRADQASVEDGQDRRYSQRMVNARASN
jgi:hypothetical protein